MDTPQTTTEELVRQLLETAEEAAQRTKEYEALARQDELTRARDKLARMLWPTLWQALGIDPQTAVAGRETPGGSYRTFGAVTVDGLKIPTQAELVKDVLKLRIGDEGLHIEAHISGDAILKDVGEALWASVRKAQADREKAVRERVSALEWAIGNWPAMGMIPGQGAAVVSGCHIDQVDIPEGEKARLRMALSQHMVTWRHERAQRRQAERARRQMILGTYAAPLVRLAQAYVAEFDTYTQACEEWAEEWTDRLWEPAELWVVRYAPLGPYDQAQGESLVQALVCFEAPEDIIASGTLPWSVTKVRADGTVQEHFYIGALLDAQPLPPAQRSVAEAAAYYRSFFAGSYVVNVPAFLKTDPPPAPSAPPPFYEWAAAKMATERWLQRWLEWHTARDIAATPPDVLATDMTQYWQEDL